jgi:hypothetical protein
MTRTTWILRAAMPLAAMALTACGGSSSGPSPSASCDADAAEGIAVATSDPYGGRYTLGYPPYAVAGCSLAYVTPSGELVLRDLVDARERSLEAASSTPRRPAIAGDLVAWEATLDGRDVVRVLGPTGAITLTGAFDHAREPRVAEDAVVFTAWLGEDDTSDTDVLLYTPSTGAIEVVGGGPGQQRFADISATHVAWTDFAEDPDGVFGDDSGDAADIVVRDRASGATTPLVRPGKQAFPELGAPGKIAYLDWGLVHPEPKFGGYDLRVADIDGGGDALAAQILTHAPYLRPAARGSRLDWVSAESVGGDLSLMQRAVDLQTPAETVGEFGEESAFGPVATDGFTLVGASPSGGLVTLRAFAR